MLREGLSTALILALVACGGDPATNDVGAGTIAGIETSAAGIATYLNGTQYAAWTHEVQVHDSAGPHGKVKVYFNDTLTASLMASNATHPKGSVAIKELYKSDGNTLDGYAVMIKADEGAPAESWIWFEGFLPEVGADAYGRGLSGCDGCHSSGKDKVVSRLP